MVNETSNSKDYINIVKKQIDTLLSKDSSNVYKFINKVVNRLDNILTAIDKFLINNNINVKDIYSKSKNKVNNVIDYIKNKTKIENIGKKYTNMFIGNTKTKIKSIFKRFKKTPEGPPEESNNQETENSETKNSETDKVSNEENIVDNTKKEPSIFTKLKEKMLRRKKEVEEEKKRGGIIGKLKDDDSILGKIFSVVTGIGTILGGLGRVLLSGISDIIGKLSINLLTKLPSAIAKSMGTIFDLSKFISGKTSRLSKLISPGLKLAKNVAKTAFRVGAGLLRGGGGALLRAGAMLLTGPVGWGIAAATAIYAGYKFYKYLHRNDISDDIYGNFLKLRLLTYGFDSNKKNNYSKIFDLEMLLKDNIEYNNYEVTVKKLTQEQLENVLEIFNIKREEEDKYSLLMNWLGKRFLPAFKEHIRALYTINNTIYLDELDKLKDSQLYELISILKIPTNIYDFVNVPTFDDTTIYCTKKDVDNKVIEITNKLKEKVERKEKDNKSTTPQTNKSTTPQTNKPNIYDQKSYTERYKEILNKQKLQTSSSSIPTPVPSPVNSSEPISTSKSEEGEDKPATTSSNSGLEQKIYGKINIATGELIQSNNLVGVKPVIPKEKIYNLDPNVRELFLGMSKEYNSITGKEIQVNEAFRSHEDQKRLYNAKKDKAAAPGTSTHEYGLAIDIQSDTADELDKLGLLRKYGFTRPVGGEKWHLEPIGVSINPEKAKSDVLARAEAVISSPGKGGDGYGTLPNSREKGRDIPYQKEIYESNKENIVNIAEPKPKISNSDNIIKTSYSGNTPTIPHIPQATPALYTENKNIQSNIKPEISPYKMISTINENISKISQPVNNINIDTKNMESLMSSQLESLKQIVDVLSSIDSKIDINKLQNITIPKKEVITNKKEPLRISDASIDLSKIKSVTYGIRG